MTDRRDVIQFEIAELASAARLTRRLAPTWKVALFERDQLNLVLAELRARPDDLAVLLRDVEAWVDEESLCAIRFELDGRDYVLHSGEADWQFLARAGIA